MTNLCSKYLYKPSLTTKLATLLNNDDVSITLFEWLLSIFLKIKLDVGQNKASGNLKSNCSNLSFRKVEKSI